MMCADFKSIQSQKLSWPDAIYGWNSRSFFVGHAKLITHLSLGIFLLLWNFSVHDFVYKAIKRVLRRVARRSAHRNSRVQTCPLVPTLNSSAAYSQDSKLIHKTWKEPTAEYPCVHTQYVNWGQSLDTWPFWMAHPLSHFNNSILRFLKSKAFLDWI